jgi:hypothetical protein
MIEFTRYYGRFTDVRSSLTGLPQWARSIVAIFAIPGIVLLGLSLLAFIVSLLALLLLTAPVYVLLKRLVGTNRQPSDGYVQTAVESPGTKRVEATIVE